MQIRGDFSNRDLLTLSPAGGEALKLTRGELLKGIIEGVKENGLLMVNLKGQMVEAQTMVDVSVGQELLLLVDEFRDGQAFLKVVTPQMMDEWQKERITGNLVNLGVKADENLVELAQKLIQYNLPVTKENMDTLLKTARELGGTNGKNFELAALGLAGGIKLEPELLTALRQFLLNPTQVNKNLKETVKLLASATVEEGGAATALEQPGLSVTAKPSITISPDQNALTRVPYNKPAAPTTSVMTLGMEDNIQPQTTGGVNTESTILPQPVVMSSDKPVILTIENQSQVKTQAAPTDQLAAADEVDLLTKTDKAQVNPMPLPLSSDNTGVDRPNTGTDKPVINTMPTPTLILDEEETKLQNALKGSVTPPVDISNTVEDNDGENASVARVINLTSTAGEEPQAVNIKMVGTEESLPASELQTTGTQQNFDDSDLPGGPNLNRKIETFLKAVLTSLVVSEGKPEELIRQLEKHFGENREVLQALKLVREVIDKELEEGQTGLTRAAVNQVQTAQQEVLGQAVFNSLDWNGKESQLNYYYYAIPVEVYGRDHMVELKIFKDPKNRRRLDDMSEVNLAVGLNTSSMGQVVFHVSWRTPNDIKLQGAVNNEKAKGLLEANIELLTSNLTALGFQIDFQGIKLAEQREKFRPEMTRVSTEATKMLGIDIKV